MVFIDLVRRYYQLPVGLFLQEIRDEYLLVGQPAASGNEHLAGRLELFDDGQHLCLLLDLQHTVEPGVANDAHVGNLQLCQQVLADLVLHKEMGEATQHTTIL